MNVENLQKIKVDGTWYLGDLLESEGTIEVKRARAFDEDADIDEVFDDWIKKQNIEELQTFKCSKVSPYLVESLTVKETILFNQRAAIMDYIKMTALARLENSFFEKDRL